MDINEVLMNELETLQSIRKWVIGVAVFVVFTEALRVSVYVIVKLNGW